MHHHVLETIIIFILSELSPCGKLPNQSDVWESTNVKNMYFAGTCTQMRDKRAASSFIHGFRYSARVLVQMLQYFRHNVPLPMDNWDCIDMDMISKHIISECFFFFLSFFFFNLYFFNFSLFSFFLFFFFIRF